MDQIMSLLADRLQLLLGCHSCNVCFLISCMNLVFQGCHADHVEFIQIGRCDA